MKTFLENLMLKVSLNQNICTICRISSRNVSKVALSDAVFVNVSSKEFFSFTKADRDRIHAKSLANRSLASLKDI